MTDLLNIQPGDVYSDGTSSIVCGDLTEVWQSLPRADIVFTDPPWNDGILKKFFQMAHRRKPYEYQTLVRQFAKIMRQVCPEGLLIIEAGDHARALIDAELLIAGAHLLDTHEYEYTRTRIPYHVSLYSFAQHYELAQELPDLPYSPKLTNEWYRERTIARLYVTPGQMVLDPFCGECYQLEMAADLGARFTGVELIPEKCARGIRRMLRRAPLKLLERTAADA